MQTPTLFNKIMFSSLLAASALYQGTVLAEGQSSPPTTPPPAVMATQSGPAMLNPEQREAFRALSKEMYGNMRDERELHDELRTLAQSNTYDEKQVRALIQKRHKEAEESMVKSSRQMHDFYKTLTPEQRKQMDAMHQQMKERMKEHMKDRSEARATKKEGDGK